MKKKNKKQKTQTHRHTQDDTKCKKYLLHKHFAVLSLTIKICKIKTAQNIDFKLNHMQELIHENKKQQKFKFLERTENAFLGVTFYLHANGMQYNTSPYL